MTTQKALHILGIIGAFLLRLVLNSADLYLDFLLRTRAGERAIPPTRRIRFPNAVRQRIRQQQGSRCMYCGVRLSRGNLHIDHIFPVEHGGSNAEENLQALCAACNIRKGVQTDREFRERYQPLLLPVISGSRPAPPQRRIPQANFRAITARTRQSDTTRARRMAVFRTPRQKISSGSTITGIIAGAVWFFAIAIIFGGDSDAAANAALFGGIAIGLAVAGGLFWRAKHTGRFDQ